MDFTLTAQGLVNDGLARIDLFHGNGILTLRAGFVGWEAQVFDDDTEYQGVYLQDFASLCLWAESVTGIPYEAPFWGLRGPV